MKNKVLYIIVLAFVILSLWSTENLTEDQVMMLMKEELEFTNELLQTQQITSRIITLKQETLTRKTGQMLQDFERLKELANRDEMLDEQSLKQAQSELDDLKSSTASISSEIQDFVTEMQSANDKRKSNYARLITLAENIIRLVSNDASTAVPIELSQQMHTSLERLKTAYQQDSFDNQAFNSFVDAFGTYAEILSRSGADITLIQIYAQQLRLIGQNIDEYNKQYASFQQAMYEYQAMLAAQEEANLELAKELERINQYQEERYFREFIFFDSGRVEIKQDYIDVMKQFADEFRDYQDHEFFIIGYSDSDPIRGKLARTYPSNWELSLARATAVARYLIEKLDISAAQIVIVGRGEYKPFFEDGVLDKTKSRRVEIKIEKIK